MIQTNDLYPGFKKYQSEYEEKALSVLRSGWYIMGEELSKFEKGYAEYIGVKNCIGVASGLDALTIALHLLGVSEGDEVIVPANTYIASVLAITHNGATPIFVEPDEYYSIDASLVERTITKNTKAIMVVHLFGMPCDMDAIVDICDRYKLNLIEDCAQSHGALYKGKMTGTFGEAGCFSFYPTKNIGAFGDGGCIATDNDELADKMCTYRNYGSEKKYNNQMIGVNSRLDEIQAGLLRVKLKHIKELTEERKTLAQRYLEGIENDRICLPKVRDNTVPTWHQFVVRTKKRDELVECLRDNGISVMIHYPIPPHLSEAYEYLGYKKGDFPITEQYADEMVSLPFYNGLTEEDQRTVIVAINSF